MANDTEGLLCCSEEGWSDPLWSQRQSLVLEVVPQPINPLTSFSMGVKTVFPWAAAWNKGFEERSSSQVHVQLRGWCSTAFDSGVVHGFPKVSKLSCAGVVGDTGDEHLVLESNFWAAQRVHTVSPCRGRRLHNTGGPRDAVPH